MPTAIVPGKEYPAVGAHPGEVLEWLKRRAWKVRILQKGIAGSNPALSAEYHE